MKRIAVLISGSGSNLRNLATECLNNLYGKCEIAVVISNRPDVLGLKIADEFGLKSLVLEDIGKKVNITHENIEAYNKFVELREKAEHFVSTFNNKSFIDAVKTVFNEASEVRDDATERISPFGKLNLWDIAKHYTALYRQKNDKFARGLAGEYADTTEGKFITFIVFLLENPIFLHFLEREKYDEDLHKILTKEKIDYIFLAGFMRILGSSFVSKWEEKIFNIHPSLLPSFGGAKAVKEALEYGAKITGCTVHYVSSGVDKGKIIAQESVQIVKDDTEETLHEKIKQLEKVVYPKVLNDLINNKL
jgi:formyltetrahydrofolate-dependent phosphoribosylglycinamide formyltransferase